MFSKRRVYLDRAAGLSGNADSPHEEGRAARAQLETAREKVARLLEVKADDIIFTSGATESNALAILGYVRAARRKRNNAHVLYLPTAHASLVENMLALKEEGVTIEPLPITRSQVDTEKLAAMLTPNTVLVSMDAICGETGVIWNTREVALVVKERKIALHVDASQAPLTEKITRSHFEADLLTFDVSKISVARGLGVLVARRTLSLEPLYRGGGQERGLRSGTVSPQLAEIFAEALESAACSRDAFVGHAAAARAAFLAALLAEMPEVVVNEGQHQAPHIVNFSLPGYDTDYLVALLDDAGFAVSTRSACESDSEQGSRAVCALTGDRARAKSTLRLSWGPETSERDLIRLVKTLKECYPLARQ